MPYFSKIILFLLIFHSLLSSAQQTPEPLITNVGIDVHLIGMGINYESPLKDNLTLNISANIQGGFYGSNNSFEYIFGTYFNAEPRYYYNRNRRALKGKKLSENAGNYIAGEIGYVSGLITISSADNVSLNGTLLMGINYGIRRNIVKNLNYEFDFGLGYGFSDGLSDFIPLLNFKLQYILFKN